MDACALARGKNGVGLELKNGDDLHFCIFAFVCLSVSCDDRFGFQGEKCCCSRTTRQSKNSLKKVISILGPNKLVIGNKINIS